MFKFVVFYLSISSLFIFKLSFAGIIQVPNDTTSIQGGIHLASAGDTVLVADGLYYENINFKGKAITVASLFIMDEDTNHINNTIIDGSQPSNPDSGSVVRFVSGEDSTSILNGFTITNGSGDRINYPSYNIFLVQGGGINIYESGGKITNNKIVNNSLHNVPGNYGKSGGGVIVVMVECGLKFAVIENNEITSNSIVDDFPIGGGIYVAGFNINHLIIIKSNKILNNIITCTSGWKAMGGGIGLESPLPSDGIMVVRNNIISRNEARGNSSFGGGIYVVYEDNSNSTVDQYPNTFISNNLISNNYSQTMAGGISVWRFPGFFGLPPNSGSGIVPQPVIINNTIVSNIASYGYGINIMNQVPLLFNNILWNKGIGLSSGEIYIGDVGTPWGLWANPYGDIELYYSDIRDTAWVDTSKGVFNLDPLFADTINYELSDASPCIGAGTDSIFIDSLWYTIPKTCFLGHNRPLPVGSNPDIGACESPLAVPTGLRQSNESIWMTYQLYQNYPNPFNPSTTIKFNLPQTRQVTLKIFNILGEEVAKLVSDKLSAGSYSYEWDAGKLASGVYLYRLQAGDYVETKKMILMK